MIGVRLTRAGPGVWSAPAARGDRGGDSVVGGGGALAEPVAAPSVLDDRGPYEAVLAVVRTVSRLSPDLRTEEAVWEAVRTSKPGSVRYLSSVAGARHSVFYHQIQEFYAFGRTRVPPEHRDSFCRTCGRTFSDSLFEENVYPLLQVGLAGPGSFQAAVVEMIRTYLERYTRGWYVVSAALSPEEIVLTFAPADPAAGAAYFRQWGFDPEESLRNTLDFVAGAIEGFAARVVARFDPSRLRASADGARGVVRLPIRAGDRFDYETLVRT
ncbi:MAG: hypothetical protein L0216_01440, partial [Planctomycetales bacterium]|nr:hypothetical protein [Planctomycetales bacterium]